MYLALRSTTFRLANGLQVVVHTDTTVPAVAFTLTYKAGSRYDPPGMPGVAHLVEHLMMHNTSARRPLELSELVESHGGVRRAYTTRSHTRYESLAPRSVLPAVLRAEAERMGSFHVDGSALAREQAVILEEMRVLSGSVPYSAARDGALAEAAFTQPPNRHSAAGTPEGVRSARLEDVRAFHDACYGPNNAVLTLAGDIDAPAAHRLADRFFARVAPRDLPSPPGLAEPPLAATVRRRVGDRFASVPLLIAAWPAPSRGTTDAWALLLAATMLSSDGRLYRELAREGLALDASCTCPWWGGTFAPCDPDLFGITITLKRGASSEAALAVADVVLADLSANVIESHLVAAKNQTALAWTRMLDSLLDRARVLSDYAGLIGDPARIADDCAAIAAITPAQAGDALRTWIVGRPRVVIEAQPDPEAVLPDVPPPATAPERPRTITDVGEVARRTRVLRRSAGEPPIDRFALSNGLEVHCIRDRRLPLLELRLLMRGGAAAELEGEEGAATAAADFMAAQLAAGRGMDATPAALGWTMTMTVGPTDVTLRAGGLSRTAPQFVRAAAAIVNTPDDCPDHALARWADSKREEVRIRSARLPVIASQRMRRRLFGTHAFGRIDHFGRRDLTDRELAAVTQASVRRWRHRAMSPDATELMVVGDVELAMLRDVLEEAFREWPPAAPGASPAPPTAPVAGVEIVDQPGCGSTFVLLGQTGPAGPAHPDHLACLVANELLGGGSTLSRLFDRLRVQNRYTYYSLYSELRTFGDTSVWLVWAGVRDEVAAATLAEIQREIARLRDELVPESTLETIKRYVSGRFLLQRASIANQADALAELVRNRQDAAHELATFHERLAPLTPTHVRDVARRYLDPARMITIVVGETAQLEPLLAG